MIMQENCGITEKLRLSLIHPFLNVQIHKNCIINENQIDYLINLFNPKTCTKLAYFTESDDARKLFYHVPSA